MTSMLLKNKLHSSIFNWVSNYHGKTVAIFYALLNNHTIKNTVLKLAHMISEGVYMHMIWYKIKNDNNILIVQYMISNKLHHIHTQIISSYIIYAYLNNINTAIDFTKTNEENWQMMPELHGIFLIRIQKPSYYYLDQQHVKIIRMKNLTHKVT